MYNSFDEFESDMKRLFAQEQRFYRAKGNNKAVKKRKQNIDLIKIMYHQLKANKRYNATNHHDSVVHQNKKIKIYHNDINTKYNNSVSDNIERKDRKKINDDCNAIIRNNNDALNTNENNNANEITIDVETNNIHINTNQNADTQPNIQACGINISSINENSTAGHSKTIHCDCKHNKTQAKDAKSDVTKVADVIVKPKKRKKCSLLFVGETGTGKSTLLAAFADFMNGVKFEEVKCTEKIAAKGQSQTKISSQYLLSNDEWAVNIIDTPGIGDTEGFSTDQKHLDNIIKHVGKFGDFNAVCILIKRGTTRSTTRLKYIIGELKAHMPKDVQNNFIVIMTRSDMLIPDKDTLKVIESLQLPIDNIIPINNCSYEELDLSKYSKDSPIRKTVKERQKTDYYANHKYLQLLLEHAFKMKPYQGGKILSLKIQRDKLKEEVGLLKMKIDDSFEIQKQIQENIVALKSAKNIEELNKAYNQSKKAPKFTYFKENGKITTHCNACSKACHINCGLNYGDDLNFCSASMRGFCVKCKCSMSSHTHLGWKKKTEYETIECINLQMKLEWENAKDRAKMIQEQQNMMQNKLKSLENERERYVKSIQNKYSELKSIAIVGYNECFGTYINECIKAAQKDPHLMHRQKQQKIKMYNNALNRFKLLKDVVRNELNDLSKYANYQ